MEMMKCTHWECRVDKYYVGEGKKGKWEHEESTAWHSLRPEDCPACGEKGEELI